MARRVGIVDAVAWASCNYERVVDEDATGRVVLRWEAAETPPPSDLAKSYLKFAAKNPTHFFSQTVPKFLSNEEEEFPEDLVRAEKRQVNAIRSTLAQYVERAG